MNLMPLDLDGLRMSELPPAYSLPVRHWPTAVAYRIRAPMLSAAKRALRRVPSTATTDISDALFVIGYWRSGTTLLHELLAVDQSRITPTTHQCFNPQSFSLLGVGRHSATRPMDEMRISSDSPQEDEFALAGLGARSPYHLWLSPSRLARNWEHGLTFEDASSQDAWFSVFSGFAQDIAMGSGRRLLLKSPPHAFRADLLARKLPASKFIYVARAPIEVYHSTINMINKMLELYALEAWKPTDVEDYVIRTRLLLARRVRAFASQLAGPRFAYLRFDDLIADPEGQVLNALREIGEPCTDLFAERLAKTVAERQAYSRRYIANGLTLPHRAAAEWAEITRAWNAGEVT